MVDSAAKGFPGPPELPVGTYRFHSNAFINYQLQRLWSEGYARMEDVQAAASAIRRSEDPVVVFTRLAEHAESEGRLRNGAFTSVPPNFSRLQMRNVPRTNASSACSSVLSPTKASSAS